MSDAAGATFLLFVGLLPAALAAVMVPFLNYVPFEEASVRSCFTSGACITFWGGGRRQDEQRSVPATIAS